MSTKTRHSMYKFFCRECGDVKEVRFKSHVKKFCSRSCYWKSMEGKPWFDITEKHRIERRERMMGEKNPMWKGGDSDKERRNSTYKNWRRRVFERDEFTCRHCGYFNGCGIKRRDLNAHHIVHWIESIELRYEIDNGITLCVPCHIKEHTDKN